MQTVQFEHAAQEATRRDYLHEVEHQAERIARLESAIDEAVATAPERMRAVIEALQALRGVAQMTAATIVAELGELSRFAQPRQLMGYSGVVAREHSSGDRIGGAGSPRPAMPTCDGCCGSGVGVSAPPSVGAALRKRQAPVSEEVKEIAWKAQHRLHERYRICWHAANANKKS